MIPSSVRGRGPSGDRAPLRISAPSCRRHDPRHRSLSLRLGAALVPVTAAVLALTVGAASAERLRLPPRGDRSVYDLAAVLSPQTLEALERRHEDLFRKTGAALVVITVRRLEDETLSDFALRVHTDWGVGKKGQDRGIVVAVTTEKPHVFVSTGYGVEGFLTDGRVGAILDGYFVGPLRSKDFDTALLQASAQLVAACAPEYGVTIDGIGPSEAPRGPGGFPPILFFLLLFIALFVFRVFIIPRGRYRGVWYGGGFGGGGFGGGGFGGGGGGFGGFGGGG